MHPILKELTERRRFGMKPGLEKIRVLLEHLDNPHLSMAAIHIAGTNGKGSVAAVCESVIRSAGYPVGRYTSPHLNFINERFVINGSPVTDEALVSAAERVCSAISDIEKSDDLKITFFEAMTALAFLLFRDAGIKIVVLETGLGGCLDATNVVEPLVSVISRVGLDHCEWLGDTLEEIASEKAGIVKPGRPVVIAENRDEVISVISGFAQQCGSPVALASDSVSITKLSGDLSCQAVKISTGVRDLPKINVPMAARFHLENIAAAVCALDIIHELGINIDDEAFVKGLSLVSWKGRFQKVHDDPVVILDGAHNPDAASALHQALKQCGIKDHLFLVAGFCGEKNAVDFLKRLNSSIAMALAVEIDNSRSFKAKETAALMRSAGIRDVAELESVENALQSAMKLAKECDGTVLVTGSLFLVAEALEVFDDEFTAGQRNLNENQL